MAWHTNIIDHTFYINLAHRTDKRQHIEQTIKQMEITSFERFEGVDKHNLQDRLPPPDQHTFNTFSRRYKPGHIYCNCSHYLLYKLIKQRQYKKVLILEDDAQLTPHFWEHIEQVAQELETLPHTAFYFYPANQAHLKRSPSPILGRLKNYYNRPAHAYLINAEHFTDIVDQLIHYTHPYTPSVLGKGQYALDKRITYPLARSGHAFCAPATMLQQADKLFCPDNNRQLRLQETKEKPWLQNRSTGPIEGHETN